MQKSNLQMDPNANEFSPRAISAALSTSVQVTAPPDLPLPFRQVTAPPPGPFHQDSGLRPSFVYTEPIQHPVSHEQANRIYQNHQRMNSALFEPQTTYRDLMNERGQSAVRSLPWPSPEYQQWAQQGHRGSGSWLGNDSVVRTNISNPQFNLLQHHDETNRLGGPSTLNEASNTAAMMANESPFSGRFMFPNQFRPEASIVTMCSNRLSHGYCDGSDGCPPPEGTDKDRKLEVIPAISETIEAHEEQGSEDDQTTIRGYEKPAVGCYEAGCSALENFDTVAQGPFVVGPHANSSPYELRALIYSIISKNNKLREEVNSPLTNTQGKSPAKKECDPIGDGVKELVQIINECSNQMDIYREIIRKQQPRLLEFSRILRGASNDFKRVTDQSQKLEILRTTSEDLNSAIRRHRICESLHAVLRGEQTWVQSTNYLGQ